MLRNLLFVLLLTALIVTETLAEQGLTNQKITFSHRALNAATTATVSATFGDDCTHAGTACIIKITFPDFIVPASPTARIVSGCGDASFGTVSKDGQTVLLPLASGKTIPASSCTFSISGMRTPESAVAADSTSYLIVIVDDNGLSSRAFGGTIESIGGKPTLYSIKSECKDGGLASGTAESCDGTPCETCTANRASFHVTHGTSCTSGLKIRCDAVYKTHNVVDLYFNTAGVEGNVWCGAFLPATYAWGSANSNGYSIGSMPILTTGTGLYSRNTISIDAADSKTDHVISLFDLEPKTQYAVHCHLDDVDESAVLTVWTNPNPVLSDVSLVRSHTSLSSTSGTLTLTFTHGTALGHGAIIILTTVTTKLFISAATAGCTATAGASSLTFTTAQAASGTGTLIYTLTTTSDDAGKSAAGNEVVITCNTNLVNPASGTTVEYQLEVTGHDTMLNVVGPTFA